MTAAVAGGGGSSSRPPSREEIDQQVTAAQQALVELRQRQEVLERERGQLEEARRKRLEFEQGREEMLAHLTRGVGLLTDAEQSARRDAEQMSRTLIDLQEALEKVKMLDEAAWKAEDYTSELSRALATLENARMEWNSAQVKWPVLNGVSMVEGDRARAGGGGVEEGFFPSNRSPVEWARMGLALTWPVAAAVLLSGLVLALVLARG